MNFKYLFGVGVMGINGVGRRTLLERYCEQKKFESYNRRISGTEFHVKSLTVGGVGVRLNFFDLDMESYSSVIHHITRNWIRASKIMLIVYDITDIKSIDKISEWIQMIRNHIFIILIGNKVDLTKREVPESAGIELKQKYGLTESIEKSALRGDNMEDFDNVLKNAVSQLIRNAQEG